MLLLRPLALALLACIPYLPAMLWGGFVWDDKIYLVGAESVVAWSGLWQIWSSPAALKDYYLPLTYTTFWLEHKLWGFNPTGYHIVNVLLHLANTLLVWHLMRRMAVPGAWLVAAVFAVHPLHVESVAWITERKDVLSGLFYLAAALTWMRFVDGRFLQKTSSVVGLNCADRNADIDKFRPSWGWYAGSLALYAAALLSKLMVITLPAALLLWHWWKAKPVDWIRLSALFVIGLVVAWANIARRQDMGSFASDYSLIDRTLIAARALWFYVSKLLWPTDLAVFYPHWDVSVADMLAWGFLATCVAIVVVLWRLRHRIGHGPLAGVLFFAGTLSPVLGFVDHHYMRTYGFVADRFQYLAGIGVMAVVIGSATYGVGRLSDWWQKGALGIAAAMIVVLGTLTWQQTRVWKDDETFYRHIIALNPQAPNAHRNLGDFLYRQGRLEEALAVTLVALQLRPDQLASQQSLAATLIGLGRFEEAEAWLRRIIAHNPNILRTHSLLGLVLYEKGHYDEALAAYRIAVTKDPHFLEARLNLGGILFQLNRYEEALEHIDHALSLDPDNEIARHNRVFVLKALKKE